MMEIQRQKKVLSMMDNSYIPFLEIANSYCRHSSIYLFTRCIGILKFFVFIDDQYIFRMTVLMPMPKMIIGITSVSYLQFPVVLLQVRWKEKPRTIRKR